MTAAKTRRKKTAHLADAGPPERYQHGDTIVDVATTTPGVRAKRVETQTALDRYLATGRISRRQHEAGCRLYADWRTSGGEPRVVASYEPSIPGSGDAGREGIARKYFTDAIQAVGARLSPIVVHVCLLDHSAGDWARSKGYRTEAGMLALHLALDTLADHYGLTPSEG